MSEHEIQCAVVKWWRFYSDMEHRALLFAIPNGGLRNAVTSRRLKAEGVMAGVPDLFLAMPRAPYAGLWIELKSEKGRLSESQTEMLGLLNGQGYLAKVCRGFYAAIDCLKEYAERQP